MVILAQKKENVAREVSDLTQLKHDGDFQRTWIESDITNQDDIHQQWWDTKTTHLHIFTSKTYGQKQVFHFEAVNWRNNNKNN